MILSVQQQQQQPFYGTLSGTTQARNLNKEGAMDHGRWKKLIKIGWWSGWWVGECYFWYQLTRV